VPESGGGDKKATAVCCQDPGLLSCVAADIKPTMLGHRKLFLPATNTQLNFVGHVGSDNMTYYYRGAKGGAYAAISCKEGGLNGSMAGSCNGQVGCPPKLISSEFRSEFRSKLIATFDEIIG
jgi:hypothetical protein